MTKTTRKRLILGAKVIILLLVLGFMGKLVHGAWQNFWQNAGRAHLQNPWQRIDWRYGIVAVLGFCGVMLTSGLTWRWIAWKMGDRSPGFRMLGAYTFSQMGKYVPGKVALLLMRIDRAGRFGMSAEVCTLSTLLENALYMISGGLVGMFAIPHVADALPANFAPLRPWLWPLTIGCAMLLALACHPRVFYSLVNSLLRKMNKPEVDAAHRLKTPTLIIGVLLFLPCWMFGGLALWGSACCLHPIPIADCPWFAGAFSLSVIIGMASLLPGGTGIREAVLGTAVGIQMTQVPGISHDEAILIGTIAAIMQRVFQLAAELLLGILGAFVTARSAAKLAPPQPPSSAPEPQLPNS